MLARGSVRFVDAEDEKLVTLARAAKARASDRSAGAAVRDDIGRTYAAAAVTLGPLALSALELAAAMAASSGVERLESAAYVGAAPPDDRSRAVLAALGDPALIVADD